jgi:M6 family metalloprotease-like protein
MKMKTILALGLLTSVTGCGADGFDGPGDDPTDEPTSQSSDAVGPYTGTRKLVLVAFNPKTGSLANTPSKLFKRVWGGNAAPEDYSVTQYFTDVSGGRFTFTKATSAQGYTFDDPGTSVDDDAGVTPSDGSTVKTLKRAMWMLGSRIGTSFDTNNSGKITNGELTLMVFTAEANVGATRDFTMTMPNGLTYDGHGSVVADDTSGHTYAHELNHTLEKDESGDLYGKPTGTCHSAKMTLMSCSYPQSDYGWFGLDPWWRNNNGWETRTEATKTNLSSPSGAWKATISNYAYLKIANPDHPRQHLFFEYRTRANPYDRNVKEEGVIAWLVHPTTSGGINGIPSLIDPSLSDKAVFTLAAPVCTLNPGDTRSRGGVTGLSSGNTYKLGGKWPDYDTTIGGYVTIGDRQVNGSISITYSPTGTASCWNKTFFNPTKTIGGTVARIGRGDDNKKRWCLENFGGGMTNADDYEGAPPPVANYSDANGWTLTTTNQNYAVYRSITCAR